MTTENDENKIEKETEKSPTMDEIRKLWEKNADNIRFPQPSPLRVVDQYDRASLNDHLARFAQHAAAKGIKPTVEVIIDWLYSHKAFNERDDFVRIDRLMQMVGNGEVYPLLIMEVLDYARKVEKAAISVYDELGHLSNEFKSLKELEEALKVRLEVRKKEENEKRDSLHDVFGVHKGGLPSDADM